MVIPLAKTRAESLAESIEGDIDQGGLNAGDSLGTMDDLRRATGFARSTVSEAVRLLRDRGLVDIRPGRGGGLFVAESSPVVRLRHTLLTVRGEAGSVADAIIVRDALESAIDLDGARHRTAADIAELRSLMRTMRRTTRDIDQYFHSNWALHERIADISPNRLLRAVYVGTVRCIADQYEHAANDNPGRERAYLRERVDIHAALVRAIAAGDLEATSFAVARHAGSGRDDGGQT